MLNLVTLPFRWVRATRYALIASGAMISGLGLWLQINGVPPAGEPVISGLRGLMALVMDGPTTVFGVFSKIGGCLALLGLLGMTVHDIVPVKAPWSAGPDTLLDPVPAEPALNVAVASTWQERLAAKTGPQPGAAATKSSGSMLRIGLIGLVICAFLAVLGASLLGTAPGQTATTGTAAAPGHAMIRAHLAAAGVVNDATPVAAAFTIPKFDPAIIVPWVKAQLAQALAGDQAAMITLGAIFGGIFVLLLGIQVMFAVRRAKVTQRTSTRRISYS